MWSLIWPGAIRRDRISAFTLIEMLVATVVLAIALTIAYGVFSSSLSALRQVDPETDVYHTARLILDRMTEEIQSAYYRADLAYTGFVGEDKEVEDQPSDSLTFTAMANYFWISKTEDIKESDFLKISYSLVQEEDETRLVRRQAFEFGSFEEGLDGNSSQGHRVNRLTERVRGLDLKYYDGDEWLEEWHTSEEERLPRAVEIILVLESPQGTRLPFHAVVPISSQSERP